MTKTEMAKRLAMVERAVASLPMGLEPISARVEEFNGAPRLMVYDRTASEDDTEAMRRLTDYANDINSEVRLNPGYSDDYTAAVVDCHGVEVYELFRAGADVPTEEA